MKKAFYLGFVIALFSCSGEETTVHSTGDQNEVMEESSDTALAESQEVSDEPTVLLDVPPGTWAAWVEKYNLGYDLMDGNTELDGTTVTLEGVVDKVVDYTSIDGEKSLIACFGAKEFGKCSIMAMFPPDARKALDKAKDDGTVITFTGTVEKKSFDEIKITGCSIQ